MANEQGNETGGLGLDVELSDFISDDMAKALETEGKEKKEEKTVEEDFNSVLKSRAEVKTEEIKDEPKGEEVKEKKTATKEAATEEKEKPLSQNTEQSKDSSKVFSLAVAKVLAERGVISEITDERLKELEQTYKDNEEIGNYAVFEKIIADEVENVRGQILSTYEEDLREYIELLDAGVEKEDAIDLMRDRKQVESITPESLDENEALRKNVLFNYYKATTKFPEAKINKIIENSEATEDSIEEAKSALGELKEMHTQRIAEEKKRVADEEKATKERIEAQKKQIVEVIDKTDEIFKGVKIAKNTKEDLKNMILKQAGTDANGTPLNAIWMERSKNPVEFDMRLAYLIKQGAFKGDFSKIGKVAASKSVEELEGILKTNGKTGFAPDLSGGDEKTKDISKNISDLENLFKGM